MTGNTLRTFFLLAGMTALFMGIGYLIGGPGGAMLALVIAGGMNLFAWWNSADMVLRMHGAREIRPGETAEAGPVILRLAACERTAPYEFPQETGAFVQVDVLERGDDSHTRVFSGWLFKDNPSRNIVEHPIYDVWVKDCAMRFPGEDPLPARPSSSEPASVEEGE